jgi:prolyl-tRNA editing enzyme YbaK/EbsC (Cys-tRNA(Pro) deacylase)
MVHASAQRGDERGHPFFDRWHSWGYTLNKNPLPLSASAARVQAELDRMGTGCIVREHAVPARTAAEAAQVLACELAQITKSLIFKGASSGKPILVLTSGANRVNTDKVAAIVGEPILKADAAFTRAATGYAIGGIPPVAHPTRIDTLIDQDLLGYAVVYPAGGTPNAMFGIDPRVLREIAGAQLCDIRDE